MSREKTSNQVARAPGETKQNASEARAESEVVEIKDACIEKTEGLGTVEVRSRAGERLREAGFMSARALLVNESVLSPGFRSVAALAGWDDEALLLASSDESLIVEDSPVREARERKRATRTPALAKPPASARRSSDEAGDLESSVVEDSPVRETRDRKRSARTPALAKTPASARRRNRRARTQNIDPIDLARVGALSLEDDPVVERKENIAQPAQGNVLQDKTSVIVPEQNLPPDWKKTNPGFPRAKPSSDRSKKGSSKSAEPSPTKSEKGGSSKSAESSPTKSEKGSLKSAEPSPPKSGKGSSGPACLEQLREELSCAVCLDICFEPSTTSCGHSFCKMCLENVMEKCGLRCPKCRQTLKGNFKACPINTVLWNTVQLLFPKEVAERIKTNKERDEALKLERVNEKRNSSYINQANRGSIRNNESTRQGPVRGIGLRRPEYATTVNNFRIAFQSAAMTDQEEVIIENVGRNERVGRSNRSNSSQEELDAALASRLQREELMRTFRGDRRTRNGGDQLTSVSSAAANLRAMASRAIRLRARNQ
ncbi:hypothetical protein SUGI_0605810 [Cryptomeria japonica]|uniref:uncharacterized protein LOC131063513 n=1 Tax=Cryptomeria japonica TaxID=3369 RepID=UPI0024148ABF|nr:uncharacterized protein LOC131063513 [Cryptomeria japonica]GLJ30595.1 hypothetical protein SUGI_0605810 [Cryptomeria japonica]